jgi:Ca2+-binding RTX toxin-like protein
LRGDERANFLSAGFGNDTITGGGGDDTLVGGAGNDLYIISDAIGSVTIDERPSGFVHPSSDTVSLAGSADQEILVNELGRIVGIEAFNLAGGGNVLHLDGASVRRLSDTDVVQVFGSGADRLVFDDLAIWTRDEASGGFVTFTTRVGGNATVIAAESLVPITSGPTTGNETLFGSQDNDVVNLLAGNDFYRDFSVIDSALGDDFSLCGVGDDGSVGGDFSLCGGALIGPDRGVFRMSGGAGHDSILGTTDAETIYGDGGDDTLHGNSGTDFLDGGAGNDMLMTNGLSGYLYGGAGDDMILVGGVTLTDIAALFGPQWF